MDPERMGTTCVKLNPVSTITMHSGIPTPYSGEKRVPKGIRAAPMVGKRNSSGLRPRPGDIRRNMSFLQTGGSIVSLEFIFFENDLIVGILDLGEIKVRLCDQ